MIIKKIQSLVSSFKLSHKLNLQLNQTSRTLTMSSVLMQNELSPPENVRGMTILNRDAFRKTITVPCVTVKPQYLDTAVKSLNSVLIKLRRFKPIIEYGDEKLITLNPQITAFNDITEDIRKILTEKCEVKEELTKREIELNYDHYDYQSIFDAILPKGESGISSFSSIGHIIHLNLKDHTLPYKQLIGEVFLDKIKYSKIVINKLNIVENEFRNLNMEILAKESNDINTIVIAKENGINFEFDFSDVYWNPRLSTEHERVYNKLRTNRDVLYDVFAGVGPFAIPAAKKRYCQVIANDLNPECYKWLLHNVKRSKVQDSVTLYNLDGREFIKTIVKKDLLERVKLINLNEEDKYIPRFHIVMNLPALALEFLDAFKGLFTDDELISTKLIPLIHCYCFYRNNDLSNADSDVKEMVEKALDHPITDVEEIVNARHVAPYKWMFRISFRIPESVLYAEKSSKRLRIQ